jgi:hypothetical protein
MDQINSQDNSLSIPANATTKASRRYTNDVGLFWATVAAVGAAVIYAGIAAWQGSLMQKQVYDTHQIFLANARPWILVSKRPVVSNIQSKSEGITFALAIDYARIGPTPAGNGFVAAFVLPSIRGAPWEYVRDTTSARPDCPEEARTDEWIPFNTISDQPQEIQASGKGVSIESSPYVLVCARYDWSVDRDQHGRAIMLYRLNGPAKKGSLSLLASYNG